MKLRLLALLLIGILLLCYGCGPAPKGMTATQDEATPEQPTVSSQAPETEPVTEAVTEPITEATETPTMPTTAPTEPVTEPPTTAPTQPATEAPKPTTPAASQNKKPSGGNIQSSKPAPVITPTPVTKLPLGATPDEPSFTGFVEQGGKRYYYSKGSIHTGWLSLDGDRYYFHEDGTMAIGKVSVPGSGTRYFTSTGKECILVNPWNYVPSDYSVKLSKYGDYKVAKICLSSLKEMLSDCKNAGNQPLVTSAYRTNSYQANLYKNRVQRFLDQGYSRKKAETEAAKRVAVPGTSEHELGLAVDITDASYTNLDSKQENTDAQKWLMANSWKYGFILRYPNGKTSVTGIIYEPWHYRYVGVELATELHNSGLCLEEYFASITP